MEHRPDLSIRNTTRIRGHDDSEPSFTKMPVELLTMIAGYLEVDDNGDHRSHGTVSTELKNLRLASRQFAYLPYLLSRFFKDIRLVASAENIKRLDSGSLEPLKAYVKSITFEIPTNGEQKALELANSGKIQEAWTDTLKQLPGGTHFIITQQEQEPDTRDIQESVGQAVFNSAVSALIAAGSTIHALHIHHVARIVAWPGNKDLEGLKLENLHTLTYHPQLPEFEYDEKDKLEECNTHHKAAIATLLSKCRDTLKDLTIETRLYSFPDADTPSLPALEKFYSTSYFKTADFAAFIENSPSLTHLSLFSNHSDNEDWHSIWRAIRYHANRMEIDFTEIPCVDWTELGVHHYTGEASTSERGDDPLEDINYSLEMYLSKRGKWNRSCRMWFEQIGSEDEFTENSSGEDGEGGGLSDRSDDESDEDDEDDDDDDGNEDDEDEDNEEEGSEREVEGKENEDEDKQSEKSK